ncbi:hypothetical protein DY000_02014525 [Brassica cretica]|uniref:Secreted protein n=1 Tax=Brassica cretica TaxID=69181 RepID=A0ABQ7CY52_BRACR|nr:hypothetical protein DY000_02014525 [Brassica cretica]
MIADLGFLTSRFPILSVFAASVSSLLLGQLFMFVPEDSFFFFGHRIIELGIVFSRTTSCPTWIHVCVFVRGRSPGFFHVGAGVVSSGFCPDIFPCALPDRSRGVAKSSLLPRIRVVPRGRTARVLAVRLTAVTFAAGVFPTLSSTASPSRVCWLLRSSADMSDRALVAES